MHLVRIDEKDIVLGNQIGGLRPKCRQSVLCRIVDDQSIAILGIQVTAIFISYSGRGFSVGRYHHIFLNPDTAVVTGNNDCKITFT